MKLKSSIIGSFFVLFVVILACWGISKHSLQPFVYARVVVKMDPSLFSHTDNKHQLFLVVFDKESKLPMPYGAFRTVVSNANKDSIGEYILTEHSLQVMNPSAPRPKLMRIKARLEEEGLGGADKDGDMTGYVDLVKIGSKVEVLIDRIVSKNS